MDIFSRTIHSIETTNETLTGRGGLVLLNKYYENIGIFEIFEEKFGNLRISNKSLPVSCLFKQVFHWLNDGTSRHLSYFDTLKKDEGYAGAIELPLSLLASSHMIKRFFKKFNWAHQNSFRAILKDLFVWRLNTEQPEVINLTIDTMVMDNDEAEKRQGVTPSYKKVKGFQPLQVIWEGRIIDAIFRGGKKNGNHGTTVINMLTDLVATIRKRYKGDVPIIVRMDSGFFDISNFAALDALGVGFIASGKMYSTVHEYVACSNIIWDQYDNDKQTWQYTEFGFTCEKWHVFYRAFYTKPIYEGKQMLLDFARPENVILTNLGVNQQIFSEQQSDMAIHYESPQAIINGHHQRGADELPHRGLKDFGFEQLPFKNFHQNSAMYYCMVTAFFLFETFKRDILHEVISITSYATTIRRRFIDFAAKIIKKQGKLILKVPKAVMKSCKVDLLLKKLQTLHLPLIA
ncbi:MAG: IS1380 family transposase [Desulfobacterales bacterium]